MSASQESKTEQSVSWVIVILIIGVRGGGQGGSCPPQFGQFVDMNSGREATLFGQKTINVRITRI